MVVNSLTFIFHHLFPVSLADTTVLVFVLLCFAILGVKVNMGGRGVYCNSCRHNSIDICTALLCNSRWKVNMGGGGGGILCLVTDSRSNCSVLEY